MLCKIIRNHRTYAMCRTSLARLELDIQLNIDITLLICLKIK